MRPLGDAPFPSPRCPRWLAQCAVLFSIFVWHCERHFFRAERGLIIPEVSGAGGLRHLPFPPPIRRQMVAAAAGDDNPYAKFTPRHPRSMPGVWRLSFPPPPPSMLRITVVFSLLSPAPVAILLLGPTVRLFAAQGWGSTPVHLSTLGRGCLPPVSSLRAQLRARGLKAGALLTGGVIPNSQLCLSLFQPHWLPLIPRANVV